MRYASSINDPTITIGYATHPGRTGKNNEDDYVVFETQPTTGDGTTYPSIQVAMVADGIGGNIAGETASHLAAENFHKTFTALTSPPRRRLVEAIETANLAIYDRAINDSNLQGMGTTIVAAALLGNELFVAHAGDSRAYLIRGGRAHQLSIDHTWAQEAIDAGRLTPERAKEHPNRHVIKRFLGIAPEVEVDTMMVDYNGAPVNSDKLHEASKADVLRIQPGDTILLCSDGLTDVVSDKQIEQTVKKYNVQDAANQLIDMANKAGGPDNITVVMMQRRDPNAAPLALVSPTVGRSSMMGILLAAGLVLLALAAIYIFGLFPGGKSDSPTPEATTAIVTDAQEPTATTEPATSDPTETVAVAKVETETAPETPSEVATETATETAFPTETATEGATSTPVPDTSVGQGTVENEVKVTSDAVGTEIATTLDVTATAELSATATTAVPVQSIPESGKPPTSTPAPEHTNTPAPTETPTEAPTLTPTITHTRTPKPTATATVIGQQLAATPTVTGQQQSTKNPASGGAGKHSRNSGATP